MYVRDFPVLLARALGVTPPLDDVRRALAENLYEEQTGGLSRTSSHPRLFLRMMEGLGFAAARSPTTTRGCTPQRAATATSCASASCGAPWQAALRC